MKVLMIGGTGTIGRETGLRFVEGIHSIMTISRHASTQLSSSPLIRVSNCDRHDTQKLWRIIDGFGPDAIIDFAAYSREDALDVAMLRRSHVSTYLVLSSVAVASSTERGSLSLPIRERLYTAASGMSRYACGKIEVERALIYDAKRERNARLIILRVGEVIGSASLRELYFFLRAHKQRKQVVLPDGGQNIVHPTDVRDVAAAIFELVTNSSVPSGIYHVAGPESLPLSALLECLFQAAGHSIETVPIPRSFIEQHIGKFYYPFYPRSTTIESTKLQSLLDFSSVYSIEDAFSRSYKMLNEDPGTARNIHYVEAALSEERLHPVIDLSRESRLIENWREYDA